MERRLAFNSLVQPFMSGLDGQARIHLSAFLFNDPAVRSRLVEDGEKFYFVHRRPLDVREFRLQIYTFLPEEIKEQLPEEIVSKYGIIERGYPLKRAVKPFADRVGGDLNALYNLCYRKPLLSKMLVLRETPQGIRTFIPVPPDRNVYLFRMKLERLLTDVSS